MERDREKRGPYLYGAEYRCGHSFKRIRESDSGYMRYEFILIEQDGCGEDKSELLLLIYIHD